jgi:P-loop containing dynein motor region D4
MMLAEKCPPQPYVIAVFVSHGKEAISGRSNGLLVETCKVQEVPLDMQAKLACSIEDCLLSQIEVSKSYSYVQWRDDLRGVIIKAATASQQVVFLLSDTQFKSELFVEDLSNLLNTAGKATLQVINVTANLCTSTANIR